MSGAKIVEECAELLSAEPCLDEDYPADDLDGSVVMDLSYAKGVFPEPVCEEFDEDETGNVGSHPCSHPALCAGTGGAADEDHGRDSELVARLELFFAPAAELFGRYWQSPLSRRSGISQGHLQQVRAGTRTLTVRVERAVLSAYRTEIDLCWERAARAKAGVFRIVKAQTIRKP
jgi:hypothetical protein